MAKRFTVTPFPIEFCTGRNDRKKKMDTEQHDSAPILPAFYARHSEISHTYRIKANITGSDTRLNTVVKNVQTETNSGSVLN